MNKYLQLGKYTKGCPKSLLDKIKRIKKKKTEKEYVKNILEIIRDEFNPRKYNTTYTNNFNKSRFISVRNILKKR